MRDQPGAERGRLARGRMALAAGLLAAVVVAAVWSAPRLLAPSLDAVARRVERRYPAVAQISSQRLAALLAAGQEVIVIDAREPAEFEVSHIAGAIRIDPGAEPAQVARDLPAAVRGRPVVVYCSVGERSSRLADRARGVLAAAGAGAVYNLGGGIFRWHNERRGLVDAAGPTPFVHPYDARWGRLLTHTDLARGVR